MDVVVVEEVDVVVVEVAAVDVVLVVVDVGGAVELVAVAAAGVPLVGTELVLLLGPVAVGTAGVPLAGTELVLLLGLIVLPPPESDAITTTATKSASPHMTAGLRGTRWLSLRKGRAARPLPQRPARANYTKGRALWGLGLAS